MKFDFTYGLELEFVDIDRRDIKLPKGCSWAKKEVTLVNSNGLAVDSTGKTNNHLGGEINTPPTNTIREQLRIAERCLKLMREANAGINYRCNLQCHIGGWGSENEQMTLRRLKRIQKYIFKHFDEALMLTMGRGQFVRNPEMPAGTWMHYKERKLPEYKHDFLMGAETLKDFQMSFLKSKAGGNAPLTFMRQGINPHCYFKYGTIEFRIFWMTEELDDIRNALYFSKLFMEDALGNQDSFEVIKNFFQGKFSPELLFDKELEKGFQKTKVSKPN